MRYESQIHFCLVKRQSDITIACMPVTTRYSQSMHFASVFFMLRYSLNVS